MKVYITYDRYERDEWFSIYHISTSKPDSVKHCKEHDLFDFISYGPDDCHSFQLQEVVMTKKQYDQFMKWYTDGQSLENYGSESSELFNFMVELFDQTGVVGSRSRVLVSTDGCSDNYEVVHYYGSSKGLDTYDDDIFYEVQEELSDDEKLYEKVLKDYINHNY